MGKRALIFGISGQDGAYLAKLLLFHGYEVHGTSRDASVHSFGNLVRLGIRDQVKVHSAALGEFRSVITLLDAIQPDELYNLAGQTSVALSFDQPVETFESVTGVTLNVLECVRFSKLPLRFFNAVSSECFGETTTPATEETPFRPRSPYAMAKAAAYWATRTYREAYQLHACCGILSNHESPLRPARFVGHKIVSTAVRIAAGSGERLVLGNLSIQRDWGLAAEYVEGMWRSLQSDVPDDYIFATGETHSLRTFIDVVFEQLGLDAADHLDQSDALLRPLDLTISRLDPGKAERVLGWRANTKLRGVARALIEAEQTRGVGPLVWEEDGPAPH